MRNRYLTSALIVLSTAGIAGAAESPERGSGKSPEGIVFQITPGGTVQIAEEETEADARQAVPQPAIPQGAFRLQRAGAEKTTFLGISPSEPTPALRSQLRLPEGMGLLVEQVSPGSPAEKAGLKRYDVLRKLDDQLLVDTQQLIALIHSHKAGDQVNLEIVREGKPKTVTATLGDQQPEMPQRHLWGRMQMPGQREGMGWGAGPWAAPRRDAAASDSHTTQQITQAWTHDGAFYLMTSHEGHKNLKVTRGKEAIFDGPIDTQEQRSKLPTDVADGLSHQPKLPGAPSAQPGEDDHKETNGAQGRRKQAKPDDDEDDDR